MFTEWHILFESYNYQVGVFEYDSFTFDNRKNIYLI